MLLRALAGLVRPTGGRVVVDGRSTSHDVTAVRRHVGYVPEQFGVYPRLSIAQYLEFFAHASGVSAWERKNTVDTMLRVVDLYDARQEEAAALSRGRRRRLALARALLHNPPILLLDDPLGGLDGRGRLELVEVLKEVRGMGITLLVATHLLADLAQVCDSIVILRDGKMSGVVPLPAALAGDGPARRRVQLEAVGEREKLAEILVQQPGVLDVTEQGIGISFVYEGDREGLAAVLGNLVEGGAQVTRFGPGPDGLDELSAALAEGGNNGRMTA
jgi:ABC-2 type transport system ATP-binding protein